MSTKGKYAVQRRFKDWEPWETLIPRFDTPKEAQDYIQKTQLTPSLCRVAESYTVERFKAYKGRI